MVAYFLLGDLGTEVSDSVYFPLHNVIMEVVDL